MPVEITLTKDDHAVFSLVPFVWHDENYVGGEIARALGIKSGVAMRRIGRFVAVGLIERRPGLSLAEKTEIRRVFP